MSEQFKKYDCERRSGSSAREVYLSAARDGLDPVTLIRMLREIFALDLAAAKEVAVTASGDFKSLREYQESLLPHIERELDTLDEE